MAKQLPSYYFYIVLAVVNFKLYKMAKNKKTWYEWLLIWIGFWQLGTWTGKLIMFVYNHLHCN